MFLKLTKSVFTLLTLIFIENQTLLSQSNADDFWLNHGFTSGQTVITNTGKFYDDGGFDKYHANQNWTVKFCSENGNPITLDFSGFRTYYAGAHVIGDYVNWDYMTINYPGHSIVAYDFDTPQFSFTAPGGCITFGLISKAAPLDSGWVADISANPPPINNDPCTAATLVVGNTCAPVYYSNKGAYETVSLTQRCHKYFGGDVWFKAVVPASGQIKIESLPGTLHYAIMEVYNGTCGTLNYISCVDIPNSMPVTTLTRPVGETLYIRMFGDQAKSGTFGMCVTDPSSPITGFTGPGGVGDSSTNNLWLRADEGILNAADNPANNNENIKTWQDKSGNNNNLVQGTIGNSPVLNTSGLNSMPTLVFDGSDDQYTRELGSVGAPVMVYTVASFASNANQSLLAIGDLNNTNTFSISRDATTNYYSYTGGVMGGPALALNATYLMQAYHATAAPYHRLKLGVTAQVVTDYSPPAVTTDGTLHLGTDHLGAAFFNGKVSEILVYNKALNSAQEKIVTNYLASKYSYNIGGSDIYSYDGTYKYDVAGIGRINVNNTHTKAQSAGILAIGGANNLDDNEFLLFGHDGGSIAWSSANVPSGDPNILRLSRTWEVDETGAVGQVSVSLSKKLLPALPAGFIGYNIFVNASSNFTTGTTAYGTIYTGSEYVANNVTLNKGDFITIAAVKPVVGFDLASSSGLESVANPSISVSLNYAISVPFEVNYAVTGGTASGAGVDYSLNPFKVIFNAGQLSGLIQPTIIDDNIVEFPDEYFVITLSAPTAGVQLSPQFTHQYTILNNEIVAAPVFALGATSTRCQGAGSVTYTATATNNTSIVYSLDGPSVTGGNSIIAATGAVTFVAGWNGTSVITATANGYSGPKTATHTVTITPSVGTPVFTLGATSTRCQGAGSVTYTATATDNTGITYSLDAASGLAGNSIVPGTGAVTYVAGWSGSSVITASATGCNGPKTATHTVTITPSVGTPVFTLGATSTRCQGAGSVTYTATATDNTGITYSLDAASGLAGNSIVPGTGAVTYVAGWSVSSVITASATGCNGPKTATHTVTITPSVGTPVFTLGATSTRCQGAGSVTYTATATDNTGITYSLDAASGLAGNSIVPGTGAVTYVAGWSGSSVITASATGCNGPKTATHTVTITPSVGTPVFTLGATSTRCQGAGSVTYTATATDNTGITYSLDAASGLAGNSIVPGTGAVTYVAGWSGSSVITASATGCNGPKTATHTVTITPSVGTPVFTLGATSTRCQGAGSVTYTATATDNTGITYSLDAASGLAGNSIVPGTGAVTYVAGWSGSSVITASATGCNGPKTATHTVTITPSVGTPVFTLGATSTRCQGAGSVTYTATATDNTGITYSLDAASGLAGNSIVPGTGAVTYVAGWSGSSVITASATGCNGPKTATHTVTITPSVGTPVFTLGATSTRCQGAGSVTYTATATDNTGITYSLDAASGLAGNSIVPGTGAVTYVAGWSGSSVITASATGCNGPKTATHTVTITPSVGTPVFTLGATSTRCQGAGSVTYTATATDNTGITYSLDAASGLAGNSIVPGTGAVTYVAGWSGNSVITASATGCNGPKTATHTVTITPSVGTPVFTLGATSTRCQGAGSVTYTATATDNTGITYSLDAASGLAGNSIVPGTGAVTYVAGWSGSSVITASATGCNGPKTATHTVTITPSVGTPVFTLGATSTRCQGAGSVTYTATATDNTGITYSLDAASGLAGNSIVPGTGAVTYVAGWSGSSVITATAAGCNGPSVSDHQAITNILPTADAGSDRSICENESTQIGSSSVPGNSYSWSSVPAGFSSLIPDPNVTPLVTTQYILTETITASGCANTNSVIVTVNPLPSKPIISTSGPVSVCEGETVDLTAPASSLYLWSNGLTSQSITVSTAGSFSVSVSDGTCQSLSSDIVTVSYNPIPLKPVIVPTGNTTICQGETVLLSAPVSTKYNWSDGETTQSIEASLPGNYTVSVSDALNCSSPVSDGIIVSVNSLPAKPVITPGGPTEFCPGGNVDFTAPISDGYLWSTGETTRSINAVLTGTYSLQVIDANLCRSLPSDEVSVTVFPSPEKPVITADGPLTFLTGGKVKLTSSPAATYYWLPGGETSQSITVSTSGLYSVSVTDLNNCNSVSSDIMEVVVKTNLDKPIISLSADTSLCEGEQLILTSETAFSYLWSTGETTQSITVSDAGIYTLVISNADGIMSEVSDPVSVRVSANPQVTVDKTDVSCFGGFDGSASVVILSGSGTMNYLWSNNANTQTAAGLQAGSYNVDVTDGNGCKANASVAILQPQNIQISSTVTDAGCPDASDGQIQLNVAGGTGSYLYDWTTGSNADKVVDLAVGNYSVVVVDANNCQAEKSFDLGYLHNECFDIPGIITPNNDSHNDTWVIEGLELYPNNTVEIFNRYGKRVFYMKSYDNSWNGMFEGNELPMESYHYVINLNNGTEVRKGNITIVR